MAKVTLAIANGFYVSEVLDISGQECINYRPNIVQAPTDSPETLLGTEGLNQLTTSGDFTTNVNRGGHVKNSIDYKVNGNELIRVNDTDPFTNTVLGTISGSGRVSMADNGTQLMIVTTDGDGFIFDEDAGTPFQQITDVDFTTTSGKAQKVVYVDGFFVVTTDEKKIKHSNLNDGLTWNALDFGTAEADPDALVSPHVHQGQLYAFGTETFERFQNIGGSGFVFQRVAGSVIQKGLFAPFSIIETSNSFIWVGGGENEAPAIWQSTGGIPTKISTTAIESAIQKFTETEISEVFSYSFAQRGAFIVGFTFPNTTFEYNIVSGRWNERRSLIDSILTRFRVNSMETAYGRIIVGDSIDGRVGEISDINDEYGENIFRRISTQPFSNQNIEFFNGEIELTIESGVGDAQTPDPQIRMDYSKDGGRTFSTPRSRSMGKVGEYFRRTIWRRLGRITQTIVYRWTSTDKVVSNILKLEADFSG